MGSDPSRNGFGAGASGISNVTVRVLETALGAIPSEGVELGCELISVTSNVIFFSAL